GRPYNLLRCRKDWTLVIKVYKGTGTLQSAQTQTKGNSILGSLGMGSKPQQILDAAATEAETMAEFLRRYNLETYVLHTRGSSILTAGNYDSPEDEQLHKMQESLSRLRFDVKGPQIERNSLDLFAQPMPMRVPRL